jgi:hypothetical protein
MLELFSKEISQSVFNTLLYSDVFDYPLTTSEVYRYLSGRSASYATVCRVLSSDTRFSRTGNFFTLAGREEIVFLREQRELRSRVLLPRALAYGRVIGSLPFIRMTALTGSLAVSNVSNHEDFDYMLVTQPGRLWTARAIVLLFGRFKRWAGHTICPNVIVAENTLEWNPHDLYSARDLCQMIPITGIDVYYQLMKANPWVRDYLPNAYAEIVGISLEGKQEPISGFQRFLEMPLRGRLGESLERWEMERKIRRLTGREGFGDETVFNANLCQGNFDHHRRWTQQELGKRTGVHNKNTTSGHASAEMRIV